MSEDKHNDHGHGIAVADREHHTPAVTPPNFEPDEIAEFDRDDVAAGRNIAKMLALFFIYTIVVMSLAAWWTYVAIRQ